MRSKIKSFVSVAVVALVAGSMLAPQVGVSSYQETTQMNSIGNTDDNTYNLNSLVTETTVALEKTVDAASSRQFSGGSIDGYDRIYAKFLAETWTDSTAVFFATSENGGWDTGNTAYYDLDTSTPMIDGLQLDTGGTATGYALDISTYGVCVPIATESGLFVAGSNLLFKVENYNAGTDLDSLTVVIIKVKD